MQVINVKKKCLQQNGYRDFKQWIEDDDHVYIGRNMSFYVAGAVASKWANPFSAKKFGRKKCLELYREYILSNPALMNSLEELRGKTLGCWCAPEECHGDILISLVGANI